MIGTLLLGGAAVKFDTSMRALVGYAAFHWAQKFVITDFSLGISVPQKSDQIR